ncbi:MAG: family 10 glycosylhydrolase [Cyanobacteria bacterium SID2]|nr:family 10 glycosylhydrolase [Cyanobacteria bacterium SID2]
MLWFVRRKKQDRGRNRSSQHREDRSKRRNFRLPLALYLLPLALGWEMATAADEQLGVLRSVDNADIWPGIEQRLEASDLDYRVIDWQNVRSIADFGTARILFIPDQEALSRRQADLLTAWVQRGGRLVVSGPLAVESSRRVQRQLEELLGASWSIALPQPTSMQLFDDACTAEEEIATCSREPWMPTDRTRPQRPGGILHVADGRARVAANWRISGRGAAVVVSPTATFFGWRWGVGDESTVEFDRAWLEGAIDRLTIDSSIATTPKPSPVPQASVPPRPTPTPRSIPRPTPIPTPNPTPTPRSSSATPPRLSGETARTPAPPELSDPASQTAPPGLQVEPGNAPIDDVIALSMQKELTQLIGRVESALLAARAVEQTDGVTFSYRLRETADATLASQSDAVDTAKSVLRQFPDWLERQNYGEARSRWLAARQQLWNSYPNDRPRAQPEVRAIWLDRGSIVRAGSKDGLAPMFDRFAEAGINTVFFETVNAGYPIYPTQIAPAQNPLTEGWDPLAAAVELARERGMELHAWVWAFAVGNERHNLLLGQSAEFLGPVLEAHPEWANRDDRGQIRHSGSRKTFLDPANLEARWYLLRVIDEILLNYDVDGIQLDYIRYPFQDPSAERTYGYGEAGRQRFWELVGVDPLNLSPRQVDLWQRWTDFRVEQVTSFVEEVDRFVEERDPDAILSVAVFPQSRHDRTHKLQQDWEAWIEKGIVDAIVLMTYAKDTNRLQRLVEPLLENVPKGVPLIPAVKLHDLPDIVAIDQMQFIRDRATNGYALFAAEMLDDDLHGILSNTQRNSLQQPIPYRHPLKAASARYRTLQAEWRVALAEGRLWIDNEALEVWQHRDAQLSKALDRLAAEPTEANLSIALDRLQRYQAEFGDWLRLQRLDNSYQVTTWQQRLRSIETLLIYGRQRL